MDEERKNILEVRKQIEEHRRLAIERRSKIEEDKKKFPFINEVQPRKKIIAFYTGYTPSFNPNDPNNNSIECYGSELCTKNVAENLVANRYDVHIFSSGNCPTSSCNGVIYHNILAYPNFQRQNVIDALIISRYINFFIYNVPIVKKIIFWSHDTTVQPAFNGVMLNNNGAEFALNVLCHIDKYVALTPTHKKFILDDYLGRVRGLTETEQKKFIIIGNGLVPDFFSDQSKIIRIKDRFIYSSNPERGLDLTLDLIERLYEKRKSITLHIFYSTLNERLRKRISTIPYVTFHGKISQKELAVEMMKSEFWLYPPFFYETYCMTAIECQMAGVIPIVRKYGGLIDTVEDRGINLELKDWKSDNERNLNISNFTNTVVDATLKLMDDETEKERLRKMGFKFANEQRYSEIVKKWIKVIEE
jgi:hypothetical protein